MRRWLALITGLTLFAGVGCARQVAGTAHPDPIKPLIEVSEDGFGVVAGFDDAPVRIEIFAEPQCSHCADLQRDFGADLRHYIAIGQLAVTYRPLTFMETGNFDYSARVSNALFVVAENNGAARTPAVAFQSFVAALWSDQDPSGRGPTDDEIAEHARAAGVPDELAQRVASGESAVDTAAMDALNFEYLYLTDPANTGTPTVYDLIKDQKIDIYDNDWLDRLIASA